MSLASVALLGLAGCSGSTPEPTPPVPTAVDSAPAAVESAPSDGNCSTAKVDGTTKNAELQALATQVYAGLECGTDQSLPDQVKAAGDDPAITAAAKSAGVTVSVDSAAGGTVMTLTEGMSGCTVTVLDSADAKTLTCLDL